jgi:hypothetical protein
MQKTVSAGLGVVAVLFVTGCQTDMTGPSPAKFSNAPSAAITFDPATGLGFVGKGDVQYTFGWNNAQLQSGAAGVMFQVNSVEISEASWTCHKFSGRDGTNEIIQERSRTTTTSTQGVIAHVVRERNQITGFYLTGYLGAATQSVETDGPAVNSCPANPSGFTLLEAAGEPSVTTVGGGLEASKDAGANWTALVEKPSL